MKKNANLQKLAAYILNELIVLGYVDMNSQDCNVITQQWAMEDIHSNAERLWVTKTLFDTETNKMHTTIREEDDLDNKFKITILGEETFIYLQYISHGEISVRAYWGLGLGATEITDPNFVKSKNSRCYGVEMKFWVERKDKGHIQGMKGNYIINPGWGAHPYMSRKVRDQLKSLPEKTFPGFANSGKFYM